jgi:hypothetical protein
MRKMLSVLLVLGCVNHGVVSAQESTAAPGLENVTVVPDVAALARSIERMSAHDRIVVVTEEGSLDGEYVEVSGGDLVVDRVLVEGGVERLAIPLSELQGVHFAPPAMQRAGARPVIVAVAIVGAVAAVLLLRWLFFTPRP